MDLKPVDELFAAHWLEGEEGRPFLAQLLASAREGNLAFRPESGLSIPTRLVYEGDEGYPTEPVVRFQDHYYLQRHWAAETEVVRALDRLIDSPPRLPLDFVPQEVTEEQGKAISRILRQSLTLLTGGPGTGKTYTAAQLIRGVLESDSNHRIAIAAPTGKAAGNLESSLRRSLGINTPEVKTLHSLLKRKAGKIRAEERLRADLILVDEASMVDVGMMATLLSAVPEGARLVLMGDAHQLPPVEAGSLFADMVSAGRPYVAHLQECLRVETRGLVELAEQVKQGKGAECLKPHGLSKEALLRCALTQFPSPFIDQITARDLDAFMQFRLLAPLRKGPFGVEGLNALFYSAFKKRRPAGSPMATPIMITRNSSSLSLYNGEVGLLMDPEQAAYFPDRKGESSLRKIPEHLLPPYEIAYALSVHKSQGSEFDRVAFILSPGCERFDRELFYTALTRAKRGFDLFGSHETLVEMIRKRGRRYSGLHLRWFPKSGM